MLKILYYDPKMGRLKDRTEVLNQRGFFVVAVDHQQVALELLYTASPDIVLLGEDVEKSDMVFLADILENQNLEESYLVKINEKLEEPLSSISYPKLVEKESFESVLKYLEKSSPKSE